MYEEKKSYKRKIIVIAVAVLVTVLIAAIIAFLITRNNKNAPTSSTSVQVDSKTLIKRGEKSEEQGKTTEALDNYKKARAQCDDSDNQCIIDTDMKVNLMTMALDREKSEEAERKKLKEEMKDPALDK